MKRVVTIDADEYEQMKRRLDEYEQMKRLDQDDSFTSQLDSLSFEIERLHKKIEFDKMHIELTEKHRTILQHIRENPGIIKQKLVNGLDGKYSRGPIFSVLKDLEKWNYIEVKKEKPNSQIHHLYVIEDNPLFSIENALSQFGEYFSGLLYNVRQSINEDIKNKKGTDNKSEILTKLLSICSHMIGVYLVCALLKWPALIADQRVLDKLHQIFYSRIGVMQSALFYLFHNIGSNGKENMEILKFIVSHFFIDPNTMKNKLDDIKHIKIGKEILKSISEFNSSLLPEEKWWHIMEAPTEIDDLSTWNSILQYWRKEQ